MEQVSFDTWRGTAANLPRLVRTDNVKSGVLSWTKNCVWGIGRQFSGVDGGSISEVVGIWNRHI